MKKLNLIHRETMSLRKERKERRRKDKKRKEEGLSVMVILAWGFVWLTWLA